MCRGYAAGGRDVSRYPRSVWPGARGGDLDFRGTLGVDREAPVGFSAIRLSFDLDAEADEEQLATLSKLTERYCVVYQTLACTPAVSTTVAIA